MTNPINLSLTAAVNAALATVPAAGRFGDRKVFITALWAALQGDLAVTPSTTIADLKRWLVEANREGLVNLCRADLLGAMDWPTVQASEIHDRGARFHFVVDPAVRS